MSTAAVTEKLSTAAVTEELSTAAVTEELSTEEFLSYVDVVVRERPVKTKVCFYFFFCRFFFSNLTYIFQIF